MNKVQVGELASRLVALLAERGYTLATAESCTGGSIAAAITQVAGCSAVFNGSVVSYSNAVKVAALGVSESVLAAHGAVSKPVVRQMARGVQALTKSYCAVATSGIAGPGGGTPEKPVGTVWVAVAVGDAVETHLLQLRDEGRKCNIEHAVCRVLALLCDAVEASQ